MNMKKLLIIFAFVMLVCFCFVACDERSEYEILLSVNDEIVHSDIVGNGDVYKYEPIKIEDGEDFIFEGWYMDRNFTTPYESSRINGKKTVLYAKIEKIYNITLNYKNNSTVYCVERIKASSINDYTPKEIEDEFFEFEGWYMDAAFTIPFDKGALVIGENNIYAKGFVFYKIQYIIGNEYGRIVGESVQKVKEGDSCNPVEVELNSKCRFVEWDDGVKSLSRSDIATEDRRYTAIAKHEYNLDVSILNKCEGTVSGQMNQCVLEGEQCTPLRAEANLGYKFVCWSNGDTNAELSTNLETDLNIYPVFSLNFLDVPIMTIDTIDSQPIVSKEEYLQCVITIFNIDGTTDLVEAGAQIKGRGNATWYYPKQPYRIKFNSKQKVLGMNKNKNWALLANYCDKTLLRSAIGFKTSQLIGKEYTVDSRFVVLMLNGEYLGLYQIAELIKEGSDRVNISDDGFIIENSQYDDKENKFYSAVDNNFYNFKYPDDDEITELQVAYAKSAIDSFESVLYADDSIAFSEEYGYRNLIDVESFAKWFLIHNVLLNVDTNRYIYKYDNTDSSKLFMGPVWDFEWSIGIGWYYGDRPYPNHELVVSIYQERLLEDSYYKSVVKSIWEQVRDTIKQDLIAYINGLAEDMADSIALNFQKWQILDQQISVGGIPLGSFIAELECDIAYLSMHVDWLDGIIMAW